MTNFNENLNGKAIFNNYPSLPECIYRNTSLDDIWTDYIYTLRDESVNDTQKIYNFEYANILENLYEQISDNNISKCRNVYHKYRMHMLKFAKEKNIKITLKRRQKDFLGINEKIRLFFASPQKSMNSLFDILGFRVILHTKKKDDLQSIKLAYEFMNETIRFFVLNFKAALEHVETKCSSIKFPNEIYIPEKSFILPGYIDSVKDYIINPKENTYYQGLHIIVKLPNGTFFEIQIRTFAMDKRAEYGNAIHTDYKEEKYKNVLINIDYSKVNLDGFDYLGKGKFYDLVGLRDSIDPFN